MGNHEYCSDCGANDFHHGRPCDLAQYAKRQRECEARWKIVVEATDFALYHPEAVLELKRKLENQ